MRWRNKTDEAGSILVLVLVFVTMVLIGITAASHVIRSGFKVGWLRRTEGDLKLTAEGGLNLAKSDLLDRALKSDFIAPAANGKFVTPSGGPQVVGLKGSAPPTLPRLATTDDGIKLSLWYFPGGLNSIDNSLPKQFTVISVAENIKTGQKYTVESLISIQNLNFSEVAYGILGPLLQPKTGGNYYFVPSFYDGPVYFGDFGTNRPVFQEFISGDQINQTTHRFDGPVLFAKKPSGGVDPYDNNDENNEVIFEKGYVTGYKLDNFVPSTKFAQLQSTATINLTGERCLQFKDDGSFDEYDCKPDWTSAKDRYKVPPTGTVPNHLISGPTVISADADVEIRGIVRGQVTVVTKENVRLGGDVQYADQTEESTDKLGVVSWKNIVIPTYVPGGDRPFGDPSVVYPPPPSPPSPVYDGITNYPVPNDRNLGDSRYVFPYDYPGAPPQGPDKFKNQPYNLDLDGSFYSMNGFLDVEGFNDYTTSPLTGTFVYDKNDYDSVNKSWVKRSVEPLTTKPLYTFTGFCNVNDLNHCAISGRTAGVEPMHCFAPLVAGSCPYQNEVARQPMNQIVIYGGLVTKDYGKIQYYFRGYRTLGFERKYIQADRREIHPPHFSDTTAPKLTEIWRKSSPGNSPLLVGR